MTDPLVSVVMPVRNEELHVTEAIKSVLRQTHQHVELLVLDGMSTDRTKQIVQQVTRDEVRVRLLSNPGQTIPHALNLGLLAARGSYLARVDAHARVNDVYLSRALSVLEHQHDVAAVGGIRIGVARTATGRAVAAVLSSPFGVGDSINHYAQHVQDTDHASFGVYRRSVLEQVGGWDEELLVNEDVDIDHRVRERGHRIVFDPDMHIYWQVRESIPDFARQYRRYGRGKAGMLRKNGLMAARPRHAVAPLLDVVLLGSAGLALAGRVRQAALAVLPYALAVTAASVHVRRHHAAPPPPGAAVAAAFVAMHTAWGWGMLEGLLLRRSPAHSSLRESNGSQDAE